MCGSSGATQTHAAPRILALRAPMKAVYARTAACRHPISLFARRMSRTRITLPPIISHTAMWGTLRPRHRSASQRFRPWIGVALFTDHRPGESDRWCGAGTSEEASTSSQGRHASGRSDRYLSYSERFPTFKPGRLPACPHTGTLASPDPDQSTDANPRRGPSYRCRYRAVAAIADSLKVCRPSRPGTRAESKVALSPSVGRES